MNIEEIVDKLADMGLIRTNQIRGNWYSIYCPFHADGQEKRPSCGVLLQDETRNGEFYPAGFFHCFACGYTGTLSQAVSDILKSKSISQTGVEWLEENIPDYQNDTIDSLIPVETMYKLQNNYSLDYIQSKMGMKQEYVSEEELKKYRFTVPYMYERKLTDEIIEKYDIGVDMEWVPPGRKKPVPCITFPVRDRYGNTLFFCRRSIKGKLYNYPQGVNKPLYGIDMIPPGCKSLIVCESCINALTAEVYGYDAVALLGTGNQYQVKQLKELGVPEIILCFDGDEAGRRASKRLKNNLKSVSMVWEIDMPDGKDLNDCSIEEFKELYSERR